MMLTSGSHSHTQNSSSLEHELPSLPQTYRHDYGAHPLGEAEAPSIHVAKYAGKPRSADSKSWYTPFTRSASAFLSRAIEILASLTSRSSSPSESAHNRQLKEFDRRFRSAFGKFYEAAINRDPLSIQDDHGLLEQFEELQKHNEKLTFEALLLERARVNLRNISDEIDRTKVINQLKQLDFAKLPKNSKPALIALLFADIEARGLSNLSADELDWILNLYADGGVQAFSRRVPKFETFLQNELQTRRETTVKHLYIALKEVVSKLKSNAADVDIAKAFEHLRKQVASESSLPTGIKQDRAKQDRLILDAFDSLDPADREFLSEAFSKEFSELYNAVNALYEAKQSGHLDRTHFENVWRFYQKLNGFDLGALESLLTPEIRQNPEIVALPHENIHDFTSTILKSITPETFDPSESGATAGKSALNFTDGNRKQEIAKLPLNQRLQRLQVMTAEELHSLTQAEHFPPIERDSPLAQKLTSLDRNIAQEIINRSIDTQEEFVQFKEHESLLAFAKRVDPQFFTKVHTTVQDLQGALSRIVQQRLKSTGLTAQNRQLATEDEHESFLWWLQERFGMQALRTLGANAIAFEEPRPLINSLLKQALAESPEQNRAFILNTLTDDELAVLESTHPLLPAKSGSPLATALETLNQEIEASREGWIHSDDPKAGWTPRDHVINALNRLSNEMGKNNLSNMRVYLEILCRNWPQMKPPRELLERTKKTLNLLVNRMDGMSSAQIAELERAFDIITPGSNPAIPAREAVYTTRFIRTAEAFLEAETVDIKKLEVLLEYSRYTGSAHSEAIREKKDAIVESLFRRASLTLEKRSHDELITLRQASKFGETSPRESIRESAKKFREYIDDLSTANTSKPTGHTLPSH